MNKLAFRIKYKLLRRDLSADEIADKSRLIAQNSMDMPIWDKQIYHVFQPISSQKEVDTAPLTALLQIREKQVAVSRSDFDNRSMQHFLLTPDVKMELNPYGIPEPVDGNMIDANSIDVVFVPLLAYDSQGNRIGYGMGFYDRFLRNCREDAIKIGLSFFPPEESIGDVYESDVRLDHCITPEKIYSFS